MTQTTPSKIGFWQILRRYRGRFTGILFLGAVGTLLGLLTPLLVQLAVDRIFLERRLEWLLPLTLTLFAASTVGLLLSGVSSYLNTWLAGRVLIDLRFRLYRHLQHLPLGFFVRSRVGDLQARLGSDLGEVQSFATEAPLAIAGSVLTLLGSVGLLLWYSPKLFLISIAFLPPAALLVRIYRKRLETEARVIRDENASLASLIQEGLTGIRLIRIYRLERREGRRFLRQNRRLLGLILRYQVVSTLAASLPSLFIGFGTVATFYLGARFVLANEMTLGSLIAFGIYQARLYGPIQGLLGLYLRLQRARAALTRVSELFDEPRAPGLLEGAPALRDFRGELEFRRVAFAYRDAAPVLSNLSFHVQPGERVALVGPSGVGKSTVLDLLFRVLSPAVGEIRIDGAPLPDVALGSFLDAVAVVSQGTFLFHESLWENIASGRDGASRADIEEAALRSGVCDFANPWPEQLETKVGERGLALSGGQRQRVSLARAILRRARLVVLDEAMSELDLESDRALFDVLAGLDPAPTLLAVTHRVDHLDRFDRVLLLDSGRITWEGTPAEWSAREPRGVLSERPSA